MSIITRQILIGACMSFVVFIFVVSGTFAVFPPVNWSELWERDVLDIPFILLVPSVSIVIGILFGFISGHYWRKQLQLVDRWLHGIEEGRSLERDSASLNELQTISNRIGKIQKQITEQAKLSQRLATEAAEDQERRMQEIISQE